MPLEHGEEVSPSTDHSAFSFFFLSDCELLEVMVTQCSATRTLGHSSFGLNVASSLGDAASNLRILIRFPHTPEMVSPSQYAAQSSALRQTLWLGVWLP